LVPADLVRLDLRSGEAGQAASRVAVIPEVRAALVEFQRRFARADGGAVLDGRDIGTVICPAAEVKLYVTASAEVRAHRRWLELGGDEARVLAEVMERDARDAGRDVAPMVAAVDALVLDTSAMTVEAAVDRAVAAVADRLESLRQMSGVTSIGSLVSFLEQHGNLHDSNIETVEWSRARRRLQLRFANAYRADDQVEEGEVYVSPFTICFDGVSSLSPDEPREFLDAPVMDLSLTEDQHFQLVTNNGDMTWRCEEVSIVP
jgi:CMP/dCMP kinase